MREAVEVLRSLEWQEWLLLWLFLLSLCAALGRSNRVEVGVAEERGACRACGARLERRAGYANDRYWRRGAVVCGPCRDAADLATREGRVAS